MSHEENESLFYEVIKNGRIFSSKVFRFQYDHRFLFSNEMVNFRNCKAVHLKNLIKFRWLR